MARGFCTLACSFCSLNPVRTQIWGGGVVSYEYEGSLETTLQNKVTGLQNSRNPKPMKVSSQVSRSKYRIFVSTLYLRLNNLLPSSKITFPNLKSNLKSPEVPSPVKAGLESGLNTHNSHKSSLKPNCVSGLKSILIQVSFVNKGLKILRTERKPWVKSQDGPKNLTW